MDLFGLKKHKEEQRKAAEAHERQLKALALEVEKEERLERAAETTGTVEHAKKYPIADWREIGTFNDANIRHKLFFDKVLRAVESLKTSGHENVEIFNSQTTSFSYQRLSYKNVKFLWDEFSNAVQRKETITVQFEDSIVLTSSWYSDRCLLSSDDGDYYEPRVTSSRSLVVGEWIDFVLEQSG